MARVLPHPPPVCHLTNFGDYSLDFLLRFWIADPQNGLSNVRGDVMLALWDAFHEHGVEIPNPQLEITYRGSLAQGRRDADPLAPSLAPD